MKLTITIAQNGAMLESEESIGVYEFDEDSLGGLVNLLYDVRNAIGPTTSRHSHQRVNISIGHGDKFSHEDGGKCDLCADGHLS